MKRRTQWQRTWTRVRAFGRKWRGFFRETIEILEPIDTVRLVITHVLFVFAEDILAAIGIRVWGGFPRVIEPPSWRRTGKTVVLAPGLQQTPFSCYPFGWFLAHAFGFRVLLLQTHPDGNHDAFEHIVHRNEWIIDATGTEPLVGIGFSKGGQDLAWLFSTLIMNDTKRRLGLVMMSTPLRGSKMARVVKTRGAAALIPGSTAIRQTIQLVHALHAHGVRMKFFCAVWDRIVRRSDSRIENAERYGGKGAPPWYWAQTLWMQFGHTAIYNPLAWIQVGWYVARLDVYNAPSA
ncbi:hypothetical protein EBS80_02595 [bacterium]|nr:hypothetical protein [bacterium]